MTIITDQFENKLKILIKEEGIVHFEKKYPHKYWIQKYKKKNNFKLYSPEKTQKQGRAAVNESNISLKPRTMRNHNFWSFEKNFRVG